MDGQTDGQTDVRTYRQTNIYIISTGPHWETLDPSVGIKNYYRDYTAEPLACSHIRCVQLKAVIL